MTPVQTPRACRRPEDRSPRCDPNAGQAFSGSGDGWADL